MDWISALHVVNLFFSGTLAGVEMAAHYGLVTGSDFLSEEDQVRLRQALILRLRVLVPLFFGPALVSTVAMAMLSTSNSGLYLRCVALIGDAFWIYARLAATMRINSATVDWDPALPPAGWQGRIAYAERFHIASLWAISLGFTCLLLACVAAPCPAHQ